MQHIWGARGHPAPSTPQPSTHLLHGPQVPRAEVPREGLGAGGQHGPGYLFGAHSITGAKLWVRGAQAAASMVLTSGMHQGQGPPA